MHPESNLRHFWSFSLFGSVFWFLIQTCLRNRWGISKLIFAPSLMAPEIIQQSLVNCCLADFGVCSAKQRPFWSFSLIDWSFILKKYLQIRQGFLQIIFAPSLMVSEVRGQSLVNWFLADVGVGFTNQWNQNQMVGFFAVFFFFFFFWCCLFFFFLKHALELQKVFSKRLFFLPWGLSSKFGKLYFGAYSSKQCT